MKIKTSIVLILCTLVFFNSFAQKSEQAKKLDEKAIQFYSEEKYEDAITNFQKAIDSESQENEQDYNFLANCEENIAYSFYQLAKYKESYNAFQKAVPHYQKAENTAGLKTTLSNLSNLHIIIRYYDVTLDAKKTENLEKFYVFHSVDSIIRRNADTMWIYTQVGSNENIYQKHNAFAISTHSADEPDRGNNTLGKGKLVKIESNYAIYAIVISNFEDKSLWPRIGDILQVTCEVPIIDHYSIVRELASYNIIFKDLDNTILYDKQELLHLNTPGFDNALLRVFLADLYASYESLVDYDEPSLNEKLEGGKFRGKTLLESLKEATLADVASFLNFVRSYPAKYMGIQWKINETYATWVINETPQGEYDPFILENLRLLPASYMDEYLHDVAYYVDDSTFNKWNEEVYKMYADGNTEEAYALVDKIIKLSKLKNDSLNTSIFLNTKGYFLDVDKFYEQSIENLSEAIRYNPANFNAYYQRGNVYARQEDYGKAIIDHSKVAELLPDVAEAWGNQGWYLVLDGRVFQAQEICQKAYDLDSSTMSWVVNLGHTHLLTGDTAKAFMYYEKTLKLLDRENEFWEGPIGDFDIFIERKWKTKLVKLARLWMIDQYKANQYYYIKADSLSDLAIEYKNNAEYQKAADLMLSCYEVEKSGNKPRAYWLYWETSWLGYIYQQMKDWEQSQKYYELCLNYAKNDVKNIENVSNALDLLSWMYNNKGDMGRYYSYLERAEALEEKIAKRGKTSYLYLVTIGINKTEEVDFQYAVKDALSFSTIMQKKAINLYDSVIVKHIESADGSLLDFEDAIKEVIIHSKPNDAFVFYIAGSAALDTSSFHLLSATDENVIKEVDIRLLKTWMSNIQANNQLIVLDMFAPTFVSEYLSTKVSSEGIYSKSNQNLSILCPSGHRVEIDSLEHGLFTYQLLKAIEGQAAAMQTEDALVSVREIESFLNKTYDNEDDFMSHISYHKGRDFYLVASSDSVKFNLGEDAQIIASRGAGLAGAAMINDNNKEGEGKDYALLFATDNYNEWKDLVNPIHDASTIAKTLEDQYGFEVELVTNATRREVMSKIRQYQMKAYGENDQLFVFFAGHGSFDEVSGEGYLVCKDSKRNDEIMETYLPYSYLREHVNNIRSCNHILIALDVCFGGTFDKRVSSSDRGESVYENVNKNELIKRAKLYKSRLFLTSGGKQYVSDGDPGKHSPFAYQLLAVLRTESQRNGYVTFNKLIGSVERLKTSPRFGDFGDNEPGGEFIFNVQSEEKQLDVKFKDLK
ncbi:MAG: tetratricopeptide repeat protein [Bacteroidetes bacterium]|nr:tetratricopeptide repeat protein [Bacteroidota bacterium]MBT5530160.1 tetratricopeptide repeat protein [Cytophagia bacterium]MBT3799681.1 tetratricopeptide repeat protein [Bacteroidota bacterium]MBT3934815.1 tetratricopeptide repeat protein [Bacteroidota bacterium]MBT4338077.1 tetratricopeptide repeat protein [Bacteroidota bacterium]